MAAQALSLCGKQFVMLPGRPGLRRLTVQRTPVHLTAGLPPRQVLLMERGLLRC